MSFCWFTKTGKSRNPRNTLYVYAINPTAHIALDKNRTVFVPGQNVNGKRIYQMTLVQIKYTKYALQCTSNTYSQSTSRRT